MKIEVNEQELDVILRALMAQPYGAVVNLVPNLVRQANAVRKLEAPAPATEVK